MEGRPFIAIPLHFGVRPAQGHKGTLLALTPSMDFVDGLGIQILE
jgi:hypothetical protein